MSKSVLHLSVDKDQAWVYFELGLTDTNTTELNLSQELKEFIQML